MCGLWPIYALRKRKMIKAMMRMVPSMPPPMYMLISVGPSTPSYEHLGNHRVWALPHVASSSQDLCVGCSRTALTRVYY